MRPRLERGGYPEGGAGGMGLPVDPGYEIPSLKGPTGRRRGQPGRVGGPHTWAVL